MSGSANYPVFTDPYRPSDRGSLRLAVAVGISLFVAQLGLAGSLGSLPVSVFIKEQMHASPEALAEFWAAAGVPLYLKPLIGILLDSVPIAGSRRRSYLLIAAALGSVAWLLLGLLPRQYLPLMITAALANLAAVTAGTALGAIIVEEGQRLAATGRFAALRMLMTGAAAGVATIAGGYLSRHDLLTTGAIGAGLFALLFVTWAGFAIYPRNGPEMPARTPPREQIRDIAHARELWLVLAIFALLRAAPGFGTPLLYYQMNELHFTPVQIAWIGVLGGAAGVPGVALHAILAPRIDARRIFVLAVLCHALATLLFLDYRSLPLAIAIVAANAFTGAFAETAGFDLATRATPRAAAALGFALLVSATNATVAGSDVLGSALNTRLHVTFLNLVWLNAGTTVLALPVALLLPRSLTTRRECTR